MTDSGPYVRSSRQQLLFGTETEYAISATTASGETLEPVQAAYQLLRRASRELRSLPGRRSGDLFLENGSRLYIDCGGHPELAIAECTHPSEAVGLARAGDRLLARIAAETGEDAGCGTVTLFRTNVDYGEAGATWGSHESYLFRLPATEFQDRALLPHLVSRIIYTGAGGLAPESPGVEFTLSPRSSKIVCVRSRDSTGNRGILNAREESLSRSHRRLHIISGDTLCSDVALWLRLGATAVLAAMVDARLDPGRDVRLASPITALRDWAADATCRRIAYLEDGRTATALDVQRALLRSVEANRAQWFMPSWVDDVCEVWTRVLDLLARGPGAAATTLDWSIKRALFMDYTERQGYSWSKVVRRTAALRDGGVAGDDPELAALRRRLCEIDVRFGELGERGIFTALDRAGALTHAAPGVDAGSIERAMTTPPAMGRARLRGEAVRRFADTRGRYSCSWTSVYDTCRVQQMDLENPFETTERWVQARG